MNFFKVKKHTAHHWFGKKVKGHLQLKSLCYSVFNIVQLLCCYDEQCSWKKTLNCTPTDKFAENHKAHCIPLILETDSMVEFSLLLLLYLGFSLQLHSACSSTLISFFGRRYLTLLAKRLVSVLAFPLYYLPNDETAICNQW